MEHKPKISIVIASKNRPKTLAQWHEILKEQTLQPDMLVYSITCPEDMPDEEERFQPCLVLQGPAGSSGQRNRGLNAVINSSDIIAFFDDDYIPAPNCLENISIFMTSNMDVVGANGAILLDGIGTEEIDYDCAVKALKDAMPVHKTEFKPEIDLVGLYGCNMVIRASAVKNIRFDENLPLYAWQEDIDFAVQLGKNGRIVKTNAFLGVHQGVKSARTSGVKLGYSQVSNPIYLMKKGTMPINFGTKLMFKNVLSNHIRSFKPESWIDRRGRTRGNWLALKDIILRKIHPMRILEID